jgi:hypothetical protein
LGQSFSTLHRFSSARLFANELWQFLNCFLLQKERAEIIFCVLQNDLLILRALLFYLSLSLDSLLSSVLINAI